MIASLGHHRRPVVCQVLHSLHIGGAEVLAAEICRALRDRFQFVFACLDDGGPLAEQLRQEGHVVEVLNRQAGVDLHCGRRLGEVLQKHEVSVVHAHQYTPFFYALLARGLRSDPPLLFTEHGRQFPDSRRLKRVVCNRLLLRSRDRVVAVGEAVRQAVIRNEGIAADRVQVLFNGVKLGAIREVASDQTVRNEVRGEFGYSPDDFVVVQVARLNALKDHETAARAVAFAAKTAPWLRWLVVGDGERRGALEAAINSLGINGVTTMAGTRRDVPRLLAGADACVLSSISEGIPLSLIEGMAAQLPVVATDVGGVSEVVVPECTGLLAPSGDHETLASHLVRLASDRSFAQELGRQGAMRAEELFSFEQMVDGYARMFEELSGVVLETARV